MSKPKVLWIGDAVVQTGFARVSHNVLDNLTDRWDVAMLGVNYRGDPHRYSYPVFPAIIGGDVYGLNRIQPLLAKVQPDVVVILNDPWIVAAYLEEDGRTPFPPGLPVVAYMPVDAPNQSSGRQLMRLNRAIAYTNFGKKELVLGGYTGRCDVIPHGVDTTVYSPVPKQMALAELGLDKKLAEDSFIVGNVNRNQPRKRLDLTIQAWTQWWINAGQPRNAYLYLHCANQDQGWDVLQLSTYYGINNQLVITNPKMTAEHVVQENAMKLVYSCHDVHLNTAMGEGWGLTVHESMACRVPQIVPKYAALGEWCAGAVDFVKIGGYAVTPNGINTIGGVPDVQSIVDTIDKHYKDREHNRKMAELAYERAQAPAFQWRNVADRFHAVLSEAVNEARAMPVGVEMPAGVEAPA